MGQSPMHKVSKVRRAHSMSSAVLTSKLNGCHVGFELVKCCACDSEASSVVYDQLLCHG